MKRSISFLAAGALVLAACSGDDTSAASGSGSAGAGGTTTSASSGSSATSSGTGGDGQGGQGGGQGGQGGGQGGQGGAVLCDGVACRRGLVCCPENATPDSPHHCVPPVSSSEDCPKIP